MASHQQQFCLKWKNQHTALVDKFETFLVNKTYVDCILEADGNSVRAHKLVLSVCSEYFEALLSDQCDEQPVILLKDVSSEQLNNLIDYMYRGEVHLNEADLLPFINVARSFGIRSLMQDGEEDRDQNSSSESDEEDDDSNSNSESDDSGSSVDIINESASFRERVDSFLKLATERNAYWARMLGMSIDDDDDSSPDNRNGNDCHIENNINDRVATENTTTNEDNTAIIEIESTSSNKNGNSVNDADDNNENKVIPNTAD